MNLLFIINYFFFRSIGSGIQFFFTTKHTGSGTGLGLSLSYDIVKAHGGELKAESEVENGTAFIIKLPIV